MQIKRFDCNWKNGLSVICGIRGLAPPKVKVSEFLKK